MKSGISLTSTLALLLLVISTAYAQLPIPEASPKATVMQRIGATDVEVVYHRPSVKGRTIWGDLLPYGEIWRAGANDNTTIGFNSNVKINGEELAKYKYGFHIDLGEKEWKLIFNKVSNSWGSYSYDSKKDALQVTVVPMKTDHHMEMLTFGFENIKENSGDCFIHWGNMKASFKIEADVKSTLKEMVENSKDMTDIFHYAQYCNMNKDYEEALKYAEKAIAMEENFSTLSVKMTALMGLGKTEESEEMLGKILAKGNEAQINRMGYDMVNMKKMDHAIKVFKHNVEAHPESWNVHDSMAEAYAAKGETKKAIKHYNKAKELTSEEGQKTRIEKELTKLKG